MTAGIFISFDFTINQMLNSEAQNYNDLLNIPEITDIIVYDFDNSTERICKNFTFDYKIIKIKSYKDFNLLDKADAIFTWQWHQDLVKGTISIKQIEVYKLFSYYTNTLNRKMYFRICDNKHFMKDYKHTIEVLSKHEIIQNINGSKIFSLEKTTRINYSNCYYICNGSRSIADWCWKTLCFSMPFLNKEQIQQNTIYFSDDILFRYSENYEKFSELRKNTDKIEKLYHVGNLNDTKLECFKIIYEKCDIPTVCRLSKKPVVDEIKSISTYLEIKTPGLYNDEMYQELNKYQAYLFFGKGYADSSYHNKTLYDSSVAGTVFLIFKQIDINGIFHDLTDYYFNNEIELKEKFDWIKNNYEQHLEIQKSFLMKNLSNEIIEL